MPAQLFTAMTVEPKTLPDGSINPDSWRDLFHTWDEFDKSEPIKFAIKGWLQEDGITMYGGLPGHGKSLLGMSTTKALLTGEPLFGQSYFSVQRAKRVLYFCPEVGLGPLKHRVKLFRLEPFIQSGELLLRSLSAKEPAAITDPRILRACEGADVFLDTAIRFMEGEENSATEQRLFAQNLFALLTAGARTVTGLHHAPKRFAQDNYMDLDNALRGTNELGAMLSTAWATKQTDESQNWLYIQNIKARDFETVGAFVFEGRPHIDKTGQLQDDCPTWHCRSLTRPSRRQGRTAIEHRYRPGRADPENEGRRSPVPQNRR